MTKLFTCFLFVLSVSARRTEVTHNGAHQKGILDFIPALVIKSFAIRYRMKTLLPFTRVSLHLKLSCFEFVSFGVIFMLLVLAAVCFFVAALCLNFSTSELMSSLSIQIVVELSVLIFMSRMTPEKHSVFLSTVRYIDTVEDTTLNINKKKYFCASHARNFCYFLLLPDVPFLCVAVMGNCSNDTRH